MKFGPNHYVPVLKVKRGEKSALGAVSPTWCGWITPLLEIVERKNDKVPTVQEHLDNTFKGLASAVRPYRRVFLDVHELASDGPGAAQAAFGRARAEGIVFSPVTGVGGRFDTVAALAHANDGLALRLVREDFERGSVATEVRAFMLRCGLPCSSVDMIVDLGPVDTLIPVGVFAMASGFLQQVPDLLQWRTLTLSACAFPSSMGGVSRNSHDLVERSDWKAWHDSFYRQRQRLTRLPSFSDCAIQHSAGVEGFDFRTMTWSAAIRYALADQWLLIKGESIKVTSAKSQFPKLATNLVHGVHANLFAGASHCAGCQGVAAYARGVSGSGSAENWRRVGTIHHITVVAETIAALSWP